MEESVSAPPIMPEHLRSSLQLALVAGIGPRTMTLLLECFGSAAAVLNASEQDLLAVAGVGKKLSQRIRNSRTEIDVTREWQLCCRNHILPLLPTDEQYPRLLREIYDPPTVLFAQGTLEPADKLAIGIVGTRHASRYGLQQAERLAAGLARTGLTVVSGLARGIDAAAHRGALAVGGRTLAVLGSGILRIYPREHYGLAEQVAAQGAVLSEAPPTRQPMSSAFPQRNRIISGLSMGVIVIEAPLASGALVTARHALEQGREVFAVPGRVDVRSSRGCHQLLRDGAKLVESVEDVLRELGPTVESASSENGETVSHPAELQLSRQERAVLDCITNEATSIDQVIVATELPAHRALSTISVLEMKHLVRRLSGNYVTRKF